MTATFFEKDSAPQACKNLTDSNTKSRSVQEIHKRNFKKALNLENCQGLRNPEPPDCISQWSKSQAFMQNDKKKQVESAEPSLNQEPKTNKQTKKKKKLPRTNAKSKP